MARHPFQSGPQTILILGLNPEGETEFKPGVIPLAKEDVEFCGLEENRAFYLAFDLAEKAHRPILKNPSDAEAVVAYVEAGGVNVADVEIDKIDGFILENFVTWERNKTPVKECLREMEKALGPQTISIGAFEKRLERRKKIAVKK